MRLSELLDQACKFRGGPRLRLRSLLALCCRQGELELVSERGKLLDVSLVRELGSEPCLEIPKLHLGEREIAPKLLDSALVARKEPLKSVHNSPRPLRVPRELSMPCPSSLEVHLGREEAVLDDPESQAASAAKLEAASLLNPLRDA